MSCLVMSDHVLSTTSSSAPAELVEWTPADWITTSSMMYTCCEKVQVLTPKINRRLKQYPVRHSSC
jgi:hypothetical protein